MSEDPWVTAAQRRIEALVKELEEARALQAQTRKELVRARRLIAELVDVLIFDRPYKDWTTDRPQQREAHDVRWFPPPNEAGEK